MSTCARRVLLFIFAIIGMVAFVAGAQAQSSRRAFQPRIIGGQEAAEGKFPHQVSLQLKQNGAHFCGGSLIKDNDQESWVLTAAHCVDWLSGANSIRVISGTIQLSASRIEQDVERIIRHKNYDSQTYENDIALLKLKPLTQAQRNSDRAKPQHRKPINLPPKAEVEELSKPYAAVGVSGWGVTSEGGAVVDKLRFVDFLPIVDNETCDSSYKNIGASIGDGMICAGFRSGGYDACQGDSGGPLTVKSTISGMPYLMGVVSWGYGCARHLYYGVYTRVPAYFQWIEDQMSPSR